MMRAECLPAHAVPHQTQLYLDYLTHFSKVQNFYPNPPFEREWIRPSADRLGDFPQERRAEVAKILERQNRRWGGSAQTMSNIERLRNGAVAAVTGQQVSLFGGPLFSLLKAITAVQLADEASASGIDAVPVFWLATEDHDLAEVSSAVLLDGEGNAHRLTLTSSGTPGQPVSAAKLGPEINAALDAARKILSAGEVSEWMGEAYRPEANFGEAFAMLFARVFAQQGVILLDASDPDLHRLAMPVYRSAAEKADVITAALAERGKELERRGYHAQVKVSASSTTLFQLQNGARTPVQLSNGGFSVNRKRIANGELLRAIEAAPEEFSGNVLLRPAVQDFLLPTIAYVGGPAEVAYFAQAAVVYEQVLGRVTTIVPRISATLVEPPIERRLKRYGLAVADTFRSVEELELELAARALPEELLTRFQRAHLELDQLFEELKEPLERLDPTLTDAAKNAESKMRYQLSRLETRAANSQRRRQHETAQHALQLNHSLYPHKALQEREIAGVYFLSKYGPGLLQKLSSTLRHNCPDHQVVYL